MIVAILLKMVAIFELLNLMKKNNWPVAFFAWNSTTVIKPIFPDLLYVWRHCWQLSPGHFWSKKITIFFLHIVTCSKDHLCCCRNYQLQLRIVWEIWRMTSNYWFFKLYKANFRRVFSNIFFEFEKEWQYNQPIHICISKGRK